MTESYAERWADEINEVYGGEAGGNILWPDDLLDGEDWEDAEKRILTKAARCLRYDEPATFNAHELDVVRYLMPAHEVHQSGAVRWVLDNYGPPVDAES